MCAEVSEGYQDSGVHLFVVDARNTLDWDRQTTMGENRIWLRTFVCRCTKRCCSAATNSEGFGFFAHLSLLASSVVVVHVHPTGRRQQFCCLYCGRVWDGSIRFRATVIDTVLHCSTETGCSVLQPTIGGEEPGELDFRDFVGSALQ